jgi:hypothetical protein
MAITFKDGIQSIESQTSGGTAEQLNAAGLTNQGGESLYGGVKYNVRTTTYPSAVSTADDLKHYVGFFINIRGKSKYKNTKGWESTEITGVDENRLNRTDLGKRFNVVAGAAGAYFGAKMGVGVANKVLGNVGQTSTKAKVITKAVAGVAAGAAGAYAATLFEADKTYRIDQAILLAVNEKPNARYSVNYTDESLGVGAGVLAGGASFADINKGQFAAETTRALMLEAAQIPSNIAGALGVNFNVGNVASVATGTTPNPFREQVFKGVDFRTFQFNYKFVPRSAQEAANVENIIQAFKFHMHPEVTAGGLFYIYPSEFNIVYYYDGKENPHISKISTCVLEDVEIEYGGQGFNTFSDGMPTEINMRLKFKELETLTKERIDKGY